MDVKTAADADQIGGQRPWSNDGTGMKGPLVISAAPAIIFKPKSTGDLMSVKITQPSELIEGTLPIPGVTLLVGAKKSGKTVLAVQVAISIATGQRYLWGHCKINQHGPVLFIEQDDPGGEAAMQMMVEKSSIARRDMPCYWVCPKDLVLGPDFLFTLESSILEHGYRCIVLDSYTALRPRRKGGDPVKDEVEDFRSLDELAKRLNCTIIILHHISHGNASKGWADRAGGTYGVGMAVEAQIFIDRYEDLGINAPERLVRIEGRHIRSSARVLRFREATLDYDHIYEGNAAIEWPHVIALKGHFGDGTFRPKAIFDAMGMPSSTAHRMLSRLTAAGAIEKVGYGDYRLSRRIA
jgi:hypothetical protein